MKNIKRIKKILSYFFLLIILIGFVLLVLEFRDVIKGTIPALGNRLPINLQATVFGESFLSV